MNLPVYPFWGGTASIWTPTCSKLLFFKHCTEGTLLKTMGHKILYSLNWESKDQWC